MLGAVPTEDDWLRVGEQVAQRMDELGLGVSDLAQRSGRSDTLIRQILNAKKPSYRPEVLYDVSRSLGWPPNGIARLLRGTQPSELEDLSARFESEPPTVGGLAATGVRGLDDLTPDELGHVQALVDSLRARRHAK